MALVYDKNKKKFVESGSSAKKSNSSGKNSTYEYKGDSKKSGAVKSTLPKSTNTKSNYYQPKANKNSSYEYKGDTKFRSDEDKLSYAIAGGLDIIGRQGTAATQQSQLKQIQYTRNAGQQIDAAGLVGKSRGTAYNNLLWKNNLLQVPDLLSEEDAKTVYGIADNENRIAGGTNKAARARIGDASVLTEQQAIIDNLKKAGLERTWFGTYRLTNKDEINEAEKQYDEYVRLLRLAGMEEMYTNKPKTGMVDYSRDALQGDLMTMVHKAQGTDVGDEYQSAAKRVREFTGSTQAESDAFADPSGRWVDKYLNMYDQRMDTLNKYIAKNSSAYGTDYEFNADEYIDYMRELSSVEQRQADANKREEEWEENRTSIHNELSNQPGYAVNSKYSKGGEYWKLEDDNYTETVDYGSMLNDLVYASGTPGEFDKMIRKLEEVPNGYGAQALGWADSIRYMTDEDRSDFFAIYNTEGVEAAEDFLQNELSWKLNKQYFEAELKNREEAVKEGAGNAALYSLGSVGENILSEVAGISVAARKLMGQGVHEYDPALIWGNLADTTRSTTGGMIEEATDGVEILGHNIARMAYNGLMSAIDSGTNAALFGHGATPMLAMGAFGRSYQENVARTGDEFSAVFDSSVDAIIEAATEYFSVEGLLAETSEPLKLLLRQAWVEPTEETIGEVLRFGYDMARNGKNSKVNQQIAELQTYGYTEADAEKIAAADFMSGLAETIMTSFVSGAAGGGTAAGSIAVQQQMAQNAEYRDIGSQIAAQGNAAAIINAGLKSEDASARKLAERLAGKISDDGQLPQDAETNAELQVVAETVQEEKPTLEIKQPDNAAVQAAPAEQKPTLEIKQPDNAAVPAAEETQQEEAEQPEEMQQMRTEAAPEAAEELPELDWKDVQEQADEAATEAAAKPEKGTEAEGTKKITEVFTGSTKKLGKLYTKVVKALDVEIENRSRQDLNAAIKTRLGQLGETKLDEVTDAIAAVVLGNEITQEQKDLLEADTIRKGLLNELTLGIMGSGNWASSIESDATKAARQTRAALRTATTQTINAAAKQGNAPAAMQSAAKQSMPEATEQDTQGTLEIRAKELGSAEAGKTMIRMAEGVANTRAYVNAFEAAYDYGSTGIDKATAKASQMTTGLTDAQFEAAYNAGVNAESAAPAPIAARSGGKVTYAGGLESRLNGLDGNQRSAMNALRRIAETGIVNIEFFESEADASGNYSAENGSYDPATNTIRIDINAGRNSVGDTTSFALLRVAGHELTHFIKAQNTEGYKALRSFVTGQLTKDGSNTFDGLVARKMELQPELSYAQAVEEVVADGCEMMLKDSTAIQQLAQENRGLFNRIRGWLKNFIASVKRAFRGVEAHSQEARMIQDLEGMQKIWDDALVQAGRNVKRDGGDGVSEAPVQKMFAMRTPVEQTRNLIAIHNLNASKLKKALQLGGFPMPSIAIAKTDIGHQNFGDISLVFGRETIDPKVNRKNKVYSADAWTPTFPKIEFEADPKVEKQIRTTLTKLGSGMENYLNDRLRQVIYGIDEYLNRFEGEDGFIEYAMQNYGLKAAFLEDNGKHVEMVKTEKRVGKEYSEAMAASYQKVIDLFGGDMYEALQMPLGQIRSEYGAELERIRPGSTNSAMRLGAIIRNAAEYQQAANQPARYEQVEDYSATERSIDEQIDMQAYEAWVKDLFGGIEGNSGVYNNKPLFTDSGNRRSFASTHMPVTVENIAKAMATQGNTKNVAGFHGIKSVRAATARTFKDVAEMHKYEGRIQNRTEAEAEALNEELNDRLYDLLHTILRAKYPNGNTGIEYTYAEDALGEIFLEIADSKYTAASIQRTLAGYGHEVSIEFAEEIKQLFDDTANMPVNMYEAKPERAVSFDEVKYAVVPSDLDPDVRSRLAEAVQDVREYEAENENDRLRVLNSREDVMFSKRDGIEFVEDRYYADLIKRFEDQKPGGYTKVGKILEGSLLHRIGLPVADLSFDNSKIAFTLSKHEGSQITKEILQQVPEMLRNPVVITEDEEPGNINVFGDVWIHNSPVLVGIVVTQTPSGKNVINKIRTVHPKRNAAEKISDQTVLYIDDNKKRTRDWFLTLGTHLPLGGTKFGFIRSIAQNPPGVKMKSIRTDNLSDREILADAFESMAQNDNERSYIQKYREQAGKLAEQQERLNGIRSRIREIMFTPGKRDAATTAELNRLKTEADVVAGYINKADKRLLAFEKAKPLQDVLARERRKIEKQSTQKRHESLRKVRERRDATEIRHKIKNVLNDFNRRLKNPTEKSYIPANMVQIVIAAEEMVSTDYGREKSPKTQAKLAEIQGMYARYKSDATFAYVYDPIIEDMLSSLGSTVGNKTIYQLNNAELTAVYDTLKALQKQVTEAVKLKAGDYARNIVEAGREMAQETIAAAPLSKGKAGELLNWQLTPDKFFARLAGYKKNSVWSKVAETFTKGTEKMYEIQRDHYYHFRKWTEAAEFEKLGSTKDKDMVDIGLVDENGAPVKITRGMMLSVYMHLSSEDNARGFMYGGFSVPNMKAYYGGKVGESYGTGSTNSRGTAAILADIAEKLQDASLTDEQRAALEAEYKGAIARGEAQLDTMRWTIEGKLTQYEKSLIEAVHEWNDGKSQGYINDVTMDLYGIKKAQVQNYYPIHRDTAFVQTDFASISRNVNLENWGSLKNRVPSQAPILLTDICFEMDNSMKQMSRYVGYARAQRDFGKLYNVRLPGMKGSVKKAVSVKFGTGARFMGVSGEQYIENYIGSITGSRKSESSILTAIRRNLPRATMTLNLRVGFSQLSAIPKAAAEVGWGNMTKGLINGGAKAMFSKQAREDLARENIWFWQRWQGEGGQREFADAKGGSGAIDRAYNAIADSRIGRWLFNWCQNFDVMSTVSMRSMAEAWVAKNTSHAKGSEAYNEAVQKKYTEIIRNTQAMSTTSERSDLARSTREGDFIFTMYKSEAFANFNLLYDSIARLRKYSADLKAGANGVTQADVTQAKKKLANAATSIVIGAGLTNAVLRLAINAVMHAMNEYRNDEDEVTLKSTMTEIANGVAGDVAGMVILGSDAYEFLSAKLLGDTYYGISDSAISEVAEAIDELGKLMGYIGDKDKTLEDWKKGTGKLAMSMANMLGLPANNAKRFVTMFENHYEDIRNGEFWSFEAGANRSNSTNYRRLVNASLTGDETKWNRAWRELTDNGKDESAIQQGYRDQLKEFYGEGTISRELALELLEKHGGKDADEAYWTMEEWEFTGEGNYSKYTDLRTALKEANSTNAMAAYNELAEHGVKEDTLNSEISKLYRSGEATNMLNLELRSNRLYTSNLKLKADGEVHKDDFDSFITAIVTGRGVTTELLRLRDKGYSTSQCMSAINGAFGNKTQAYRIMETYNPGEAKTLMNRILDAYEALGLDRQEEMAWIAENWDKYEPEEQAE